MTEAKLHGEAGLVPEGDGWFVVNVAHAKWKHNERFGSWCAFEGENKFPQTGINVHVLAPGQPACLYHSESLQENFLVLSGECTLVVEGKERSMAQWDFFHCPPGVTHVFVGAGDKPCVILMIGARSADGKLLYPVDETAAAHGASTTEETPNPSEAYVGTPESTDIPSPWPLA